MKLKLICCEVLYREACWAASRSRNHIDLEFVPKGLHDLKSQEMRSRLQALIDANEEKGYEQILLGYALCNNGCAGLCARNTPLVITKAHDCITLFLGGRQRYADYFNANPGTYFLSSGWLERGANDGELKELSIQHNTGMDSSYEEFVEKYGEDNAQFLYDTLCNTTKNYGRFAYINMGIEPAEIFRAKAQAAAARQNWLLEEVPGDIGLLQRLADGPWDASEFLTVTPGHQIAATYDGDILACKKEG
ncbi:MAG: hypothetical protein A2X49_02590 [Lentisphaerae bacterium GWF2_52_8]|nr:MAG: hypothetical protein A2X49_02590 [Lentisphaerae bacterium GWF2_52_8]